MADNTLLNAGVGGDTTRSVDKGGTKTTVVTLDVGGGGAESLIAGILPVSAAALPLPAGASTSAAQTTGNGSLSSIDGKVPALGQALAIAAVPVVLPALQQAALTPPAAIVGFALDATLSGGTQKTKLVDTAGVNVASVSLAGAVKVDASSVAVPVTDNAGSLTVDAPVATPVFVRLSDGAAAIATLPVSLATNTPDVTDRAARLVGVITAANLDVALSTRLKPADALAAVTTVGAVTAITNALPVGANKIGTVDIATAAATAKGTQGANGVPTQDLRDAGRNTRIFMLDAITAAPLVEALASVVQWYGNAAVAATTTPAVVPAGKTLRLTGYKIMYQSLATVGYAVVRIRFNTAAVAALGSPLVASFEAGSGSGAATTAMTGGVTTETGSFPEGLELPAAGGIGFSFAGYGPTGALTLEGGVRFEVHGYEY